jgi:hypothetical protein
VAGRQPLPDHGRAKLCRMSTSHQLSSLYEAPLSGFLDARKALAASLKKAGDKDGAAKVAALPKPTPAAWAVNQVARRNATDLGALIELGGEIRAAMRAGLAGDSSARARLTALEGEQQELIGMLLTLAKAQLDGDGAPSSQVVLDRVKTTLTTISTTGKWGDAEPGQLTKELGIPSVETLAALLLDDTTPAPRAPRTSPAEKPKPAADGKREVAEAAERKRAHEAALKAARAVVEQARKEAEAANAAAKAARAEHEAAKATLEAEIESEAAARKQVEALEAKLADAREAARTAASAVRNAKSAMGARDDALSSATRSEATAARELVEAERKLAAITSKS